MSQLGLFREEAVEHYLKEAEGRGILRVSPPWSWLLTWTLGGLVIGALAFAILGRVEINDHGRGVLRPTGGVRLLTAPSTATVAELRARRGDFLKAGQPVARLESPELQGSLLEAQRQVDLLRSDFRSVATQQDALYARQTADHEHRLASLQADLASYEHSLETRLHEREANQRLHALGIVAELEVEKSEDAYEEAQRQLRAGQLALQQEHQAWASIEAERQQQLYTRKSDLSSAETRRQALDYNLQQNLLTAPVDGFVDGLVVRAGDRVQPGQAVCRLVPVDSPLVAISFLPEKDRPYVKEGDLVKVELNGYPYAEYGTLSGKVVRIGEDLASSAEWQEAMGDADHADGPAFRVEVQLDPRPEDPRLQPIKLRPGMLLSVRYTLRRQSLITMAFEPLKRWLR
ncbi:MAG TPA: HlyD family efflux transporter periplasmic adaptor subunit [Holophagaceae bacterium]|nr:HlyD family efflux transporter periplasmic adaptor subunit [Holophagaceae bacterium]